MPMSYHGFYRLVESNQISLIKVYVINILMKQEEGTNITVNSVHPGVIMTKLMRYSSCLMSMFFFFFHGVFKNQPDLKSLYFWFVFAEITHFFSFPLWKNVPQVKWKFKKTMQIKSGILIWLVLLPMYIEGSSHNMLCCIASKSPWNNRKILLWLQWD